LTGSGAGARAPGAWPALWAGFTVLLVATGVNFAFGILFKPILGELGVDRSTLALAATASLLVNAGGQPLFGALIDRLGPRRVVLASMALMTVGTGLVGRVDRAWQFVALYGIVAAIGYTGCGILSVAVHVSRWFPGERGFVTAVAASGFSLGHLVFTQVAAHAAAALGWRRTYGVLTVVLAVTLVALVGWLRDAPAAAAPGPTTLPGGGPATTPAGASTPRTGGSAATVPAGGPAPAPAARRPRDGAAPRLDAPPAASLDRRAALATGGFWAMTAGLMGCGFTDFLLTTHLAPHATDLGLGTAVAANAVSLWAAANVVGILAGGSLATRLGARRTLVLTYAVRAAALFYLPLVREAWQLYLFAALFGATFFTTAPLSSTLVGDLFGPAHHGAIFGAANLFHHTAGALGSYAGGLVFDLTGSYRPIFLAGALIVVGSAVVTSLARPPGRPAPSGRAGAADPRPAPRHPAGGPGTAS
jgi:MFS family permease